MVRGERLEQRVRRATLDQLRRLVAAGLDTGQPLFDRHGQLEVVGRVGQVQCELGELRDLVGDPRFAHFLLQFGHGQRH